MARVFRNTKINVKSNKKILKVSNTVIVSSQRLYNRYEKFSNNIHLLEHGTDFDMFNKVYFNKKELHK